MHPSTKPRHFLTVATVALLALAMLPSVRAAIYHFDAGGDSTLTCTTPRPVTLATNALSKCTRGTQALPPTEYGCREPLMPDQFCAACRQARGTCQSPW
ncbi:uncharacterized protein PSFLO_04259 [Pseudozyma flocculosa]|uniref:Secreted protein n=2 Tax=Pseudozyma flocculosa TaxID=84751 RepID=A0A5C3F3V5_9BASI|nr:uncharacterized protein PSFLO_04259 [Pseudozyma flocculosa]